MFHHRSNLVSTKVSFQRLLKTSKQTNEQTKVSCIYVSNTIYLINIFSLSNRGIQRVRERKSEANVEAFDHVVQKHSELIN